MNLKTTADAIAAQFANLTVTVAGRTETVTGTAHLPNSIGKLALLVYPPSGELGRDINTQRRDILDFPVRLLRDPIDMGPRSDAIYAWYDAMRDQVEKNYDLGLSYVRWAKSISVTCEIDGESYASDDGTYARYDVIELIVQVFLRETVPTDAL